MAAPQGSARRVPLPGPRPARAAEDAEAALAAGGEHEPAPSALGLVQEYWHFGFFAYGVFTIVRRRETTREVKAAQVAGLAFLLAFAFKLERVLSRRVLEPLFAKLFGDNDDLRRKIEAEEAQLRELLRKHQEGKGSADA